MIGTAPARGCSRPTAPARSLIRRKRRRGRRRGSPSIGDGAVWSATPAHGDDGWPRPPGQSSARTRARFSHVARVMQRRSPMSKNNVNPNHYKVAGRARQGEDILQQRHKQKHAQFLARERFEAHQSDAAPTATEPTPETTSEASPEPTAQQAPAQKSETGPKANPGKKAAVPRRAATAAAKAPSQKGAKKQAPAQTARASARKTATSAKRATRPAAAKRPTARKPAPARSAKRGRKK